MRARTARAIGWVESACSWPEGANMLDSFELEGAGGRLGLAVAVRVGAAWAIHARLGAEGLSAVLEAAAEGAAEPDELRGGWVRAIERDGRAARAWLSLGDGAWELWRGEVGEGRPCAEERIGEGK